MGIKKKNDKTRFVFLLFTLLTIILFSTHLYVKNNGEHILYNTIYKLLRGSEDIYNINFDIANIDLIGKFITVKNLSIKLNKNKTAREYEKRSQLIEANIPFVSITGFSFFDLLVRGNINIGKIYIKNGKLKYYSSKQNKVENPKPMKINQKKISIGEIFLDNIDFKIFSHSHVDPTSYIRGITMDVKNIKIIPGKTINERIWKNDLTFEIGVKRSFVRFLSTGYKIETGKINFSSRKNTATINKLAYFPENIRRKILNKGSFHQFKIKKILLKKPDVANFLSRKRIHAKELILFKPDIVIFRDRNIKIKKRGKNRKLPQQVLRESKLKFGLNTIRILEGNVVYKELALGQRNAGSIFFTKFNSTFLNISNFPEIIRTGIESKITASARLMGESLFEIVMLVPINNKRDRFYFTGFLNKTNLRILNNYLRKNIRIQIDGGVLKSMKFSVNADKDIATGNMKLLYKNLKVTLLRKKEPKRKRKFRTFLANTFIHKSNPGKGNKKIRTGNITFIRKSKRSIFNYMWNCLLSGIKSSIKF